MIVLSDLAEMMFKFSQMNILKSKLSPDDARHQGELAGSAMALLAKGAFITGIEYGLDATFSLDDEQAIASLAKQAFLLLRVCNTPIEREASFLVQQLVASGALSINAGLALAKSFGEKIFQSALQCFRLGVAYARSKHIQQFLWLQQILDKWSHLELPIEVEVEAFENRMAIHEFFDSANFMSFGNRHKSFSANEVRIDAVRLVQHLINSSFLIGVDQASKSPNRSREIDTELIEIFEFVSRPLFELGNYALSGGKDIVQGTKSENILQGLYTILLLTASQCYLLGVDYQRR